MLTMKGFGNNNIAFVLLFCSLAVALVLGCERQQPPSPMIKSQVEVASLKKIASQPAETVAANTSSVLPLNLKVQIDGFATDKGVCRVAVYFGKAHFNDSEFAIAKESIAVLDSKAEVLLELDLPESNSTTREPVNTNTTPKLSIAVSAYHDENDNSRLDKNSFGIPIERYGFSTNPKRGFGPPKFSEAAIELNAYKLQNEPGMQLSIPITIK